MDNSHKKTGGLLMKSLSSHPDYYRQKTRWEKELGRRLGNDEFERDYWKMPEGGAVNSGTSIFDPVLCELAYTWFTAPGATVLDPFAGGSVRGVVASCLERSYTGVDLRAEQVEENRRQAQMIVSENVPTWVVGDSRSDLPNQMFDFVFSCPPYFDLEVYSDDPKDLSTMKYGQFLEAYREIVRQCVERLREDRFACFVVGDIRTGKQGEYCNFVGDTITAFLDAGMKLYNEAILVTQVGSLAIRVGNQFRVSRKLGKTHQNVLVFLKGDAKRATHWCGEVDVMEIEGDSTQTDTFVQQE